MKLRTIILAALLAVVATSSFSCKKAIEEQYEDIIKKLMVDGSWVVTKFTEDATDITASFNGYVCKFHDNNTMTATMGTGTSATVQSGTWQTNLTAQTISAQFNSNVGLPLSLINGTWKIETTSATKAKFSQTKGGKDYIMELTKS